MATSTRCGTNFETNTSRSFERDIRVKDFYQMDIAWEAVGYLCMKLDDLLEHQLKSVVP